MGPTSFLTENRCSVLCKLSNAHLTLNFCQGPLPETHSSQNHFVKVKRNQLHLEVTWLVIRSFKREPVTALFPKFRCTFQAFSNLDVPNPPLDCHWSDDGRCHADLISLPGQQSTTAWRQKRKRQLEKGSENVVCCICCTLTEGRTKKL